MVSQVLYKRHGYRRSQRHGEPRECHITALLEGGEGSPVAMGILYTEICNRVGLPVAGMPIDDEFGQYYLLWPTKFPLKVRCCARSVTAWLHGVGHTIVCKFCEPAAVQCR